jgi:DNA-binding XRE family transcriptional regulator
VRLRWHGFMPTRPSQLTVEQSRRWESRRLKVGARIRELRLAQNLSQEALALESGLSRNMIIGIEWGRKSVAYERLWDVADVLGVPINSLFVEAKSSPSSEPFKGGRRPMGGGAAD